MTLYFNFPPKLYSNSIFLELPLEKNFESHNKFGFFFPCKIDVTEFALAKWFAYFEIIDAPLVGIECWWSRGLLPVPLIRWLCLSINLLDVTEWLFLVLCLIHLFHLRIVRTHPFCCSVLMTALAFIGFAAGWSHSCVILGREIGLMCSLLLRTRLPDFSNLSEIRVWGVKIRSV